MTTQPEDRYVEEMRVRILTEVVRRWKDGDGRQTTAKEVSTLFSTDTPAQYAIAEYALASLIFDGFVSVIVIEDKMSFRPGQVSVPANHLFRTHTVLPLEATLLERLGCVDAETFPRTAGSGYLTVPPAPVGIPLVAQRLPPYDPQVICPKCLAEMPSVTWHDEAEYWTKPKFPCTETGLTTEHLCLKCTRCSYQWVTAVALASELPFASYVNHGEESPMSLRKTGAHAPDQVVTGVEPVPGQPPQDPATKTASVASSPYAGEWLDTDERGLDAENQQADRDR